VYSFCPKREELEWILKVRMTSLSAAQTRYMLQMTETDRAAHRTEEWRSDMVYFPSADCFFSSDPADNNSAEEF